MADAFLKSIGASNFPPIGKLFSFGTTNNNEDSTEDEVLSDDNTQSDSASENNGQQATTADEAMERMSVISDDTDSNSKKHRANSRKERSRLGENVLDESNNGVMEPEQANYRIETEVQQQPKSLPQQETVDYKQLNDKIKEYRKIQKKYKTKPKPKLTGMNTIGLYLDNSNLITAYIEYQESIRLQNKNFKKIEKLYNFELNIKHLIRLLNISKKVDIGVDKVVHDKTWRRNLIINEINKGLIEDLNTEDNHENVMRIEKKDNNHNKIRKFKNQKNKKSLLFEKKYQTLFIENGILQNEHNTLQAEFTELKHKYDNLLHNSGNSGNTEDQFSESCRPLSSQSLGSFSHYESFDNSNNNFRTVKIGKKLSRTKKI